MLPFVNLLQNNLVHFVNLLCITFYSTYLGEFMLDAPGEEEFMLDAPGTWAIEDYFCRLTG